MVLMRVDVEAGLSPGLVGAPLGPLSNSCCRKALLRRLLAGRARPGRTAARPRPLIRARAAAVPAAPRASGSRSTAPAAGLRGDRSRSRRGSRRSAGASVLPPLPQRPSSS